MVARAPERSQIFAKQLSTSTDQFDIMMTFRTPKNTGWLMRVHSEWRINRRPESGRRGSNGKVSG